MPRSVRLSVTPPISERSHSSERSSSTFTISSDDGFRRPALTSGGTWLGPSQVPCQHISNLQSPTSSDTRPPALSRECSDDENSFRNELLQIPNIRTMENAVGSSRETSRARENSPITKLPSGPRRSQSGKLLNRLRNHRRLRTETATIPSTRANTFKFWKWEMFSCVLAIGTLGSMYGILFRYDGQRIPDWGTAINLSTLIALMATVLRAILSFVVAEIIGQAKWNYFAGDGRPTEHPPKRRLIETSRFNDASQGVIGAFKLLPTIFRDPATLLAVTVMVVSLGTSSFVQQAIQTQSCQFPMDSVHAFLPISRNITAGEVRVDNPNSLAAFISSFAPDNEDLGSPISVGCPTGNCTFHNSTSRIYQTLGVCSKCTDTSSLISSVEWKSTRQEVRRECDSELICENAELTSRGFQSSWTNFTLPNGMSISASINNSTSSLSSSSSSLSGQVMKLLVSSSSDLAWAGDRVSLEMNTLSQWAFANVTILTSNWLPTNVGYTDYVAATCTLYPCLRSYNASVALGKLEEVLVSTIPLVPDLVPFFQQNFTNQEKQKAVFWGDEGYRGGDIFELLPLLKTNLRAIQSPCLVSDQVWTKDNRTSTLDMQHLMLLHADPDPSGARSFAVENSTIPSECVYELDSSLGKLFHRLISETLFRGRCSGYANINENDINDYMECEQTYWLSRFYEGDGITVDSITKQIEAFTDRLSNKMRMGLLNTPQAVYGQVLQATVCSRINYSWLAFPAVLVAVTSGLLAWTIFQSSKRRGREMVWKTSILPFLFYGERFVVQNGEDVSGHSGGSSQRDEAKEPLLSLDQMEEEARQRKVRFDVS